MCKKFLIIEDDRRIQDELVDYFSNASRASNGVEAFDILKAHHSDFSWIILDLQMNEMDGIELLKKLKQENIQTPPITVVSAYLDPNSIRQCLQLGAKGLLTKPVKNKEIKRAIEAVSLTSKRDIRKFLNENSSSLEATQNSQGNTVITNIPTFELPTKTKILFFGGNFKTK